MIWDLIPGQAPVIQTLRAAVADAGRIIAGEPGDNSMTHAWLFTGPPGSGRSIAARAFAAALVCDQGGCGDCRNCQLALAGDHPDVHLYVPDRLTIGVDDARELTRRASLQPTYGRWHVLVVEDADRLNDVSGNAMLKAIEEPPPGTVWLMCAPTAEDVLPTIRSRMRHVVLSTPRVEDVAEVLIRRDGIDPAMAAFAARASQGHMGRARALAMEESVRIARMEVLRLPLSLNDAASSYTAAANLLGAATDEANARADRLDAQEEAALMRNSGEGAEGITPARIKRLASRALRELKDAQKTRRTRLIRDQIDRALLDLLAFYRDVLALQFGADVELVNAEMRPTLEDLAVRSTPTATMQRIQGIEDARARLAAAVAPALALEAMAITLAKPSLAVESA